MAENGKKEIVFLYCGIRTGNFGAGSHFETLLKGLIQSDDLKMKIIRTDSPFSREVSNTTYLGIPVLDIPQPENKLFLTAEDSPVQKVYAKRILEIAYPFFRDFEDPVFVINSIDYLNLAIEMRDSLEVCRIVYIHHAWTWKDFYNRSDQSFMEDWNTTKSPGLNQAIYFTKLQQKLAHLSDHVVTVTEQARNFFTEYLGLSQNKITRIYNGIELAETNLKNESISKVDLGLNEAEKIILYCGRIKPAKGIGVLIDAFKTIYDKHPEYRLVVVGSGDFKEMIAKTQPIAAKVTFTGRLVREDLFNWYRIASVGVLPSFHEQCSFTALEMAAHQLPMVVGEVDGLDEMYRDSVDCLKAQVSYDKDGFKAIDPLLLAEKILMMIENPEIAIQFAKNASGWVSEKYTVERMINGYKEVLMNLECSHENIPLNIHFIIMGEHVPEGVKECMNSWRQLENEGFEILEWDKKTISEFLDTHYPEFLELFLKARNLAEASDISRYLLLYHFGGIYVDWDVQLLDGLLFLEIYRSHRKGIFLLDPSNNSIACEFIAAAKGLSVLRTIIANIKKKYESGERDKLTTPFFSGPFMLREIFVEGHINASMLIEVKDAFLYDYLEIRQKPSKKERKPMIHYWIHSWITP